MIRVFVCSQKSLGTASAVFAEALNQLNEYKTQSQNPSAPLAPCAHNDPHARTHARMHARTHASTHTSPDAMLC